MLNLLIRNHSNKKPEKLQTLEKLKAIAKRLKFLLLENKLYFLIFCSKSIIGRFIEENILSSIKDSLINHEDVREEVEKKTFNFKFNLIFIPMTLKF